MATEQIFFNLAGLSEAHEPPVSVEHRNISSKAAPTILDRSVEHARLAQLQQQQQVRAPTPPRLNLAAPIKRSIFEELEEEKEANLLIKTSAPSAVNMMMITVRKPKDDAGYTVRDYVQYQQQALQNQQQQQQQQKPSAIVLLHENIKPKATRQKQPLRSDIYVKPTSVSSANTAKIWQCLWIPVLFLLRIFMWLRSKWQKPKPNVKK